MLHCDRHGCGWQAIAPSMEVAREQYAEHLIEEHAEEVEAEIPDGMVQVRLGEDGEWKTVTPEEARRLHDRYHAEDES